MAEIVIWMQSWVVITLSVGLTFVVLLLLFCCLCWQSKRRIPQFYILGGSGYKKCSKDIFSNSLNNLRLFRKLSLIKEPEEKFSSKNVPFMNVSCEAEPESDLVDSMTEKKSFENLILQFEENDEAIFPREDLRSCISTDSLNTFYSACPSMVKTNSNGSFVSVISDSDLETLIS